MTTLPLETLQRQVVEATDTLHLGPSQQQQARALLPKLREHRLFTELITLAEPLLALYPEDSEIAIWYGQGLIELGHLMAALAVLRDVEQKSNAGSYYWSEAVGLQGRIHKQLFVLSPDKCTDSARRALSMAIDIYRMAYTKAPKQSVWHGVNLVALLYRAEKLGQAPRDQTSKQLAADILAILDQQSVWNTWDYASAAEAAVALEDWNSARPRLHRYLHHPDLSAFHVASTLRQFTEIWGLDDDTPKKQALINAMRIRLVGLPGGQVEIPFQVLRTQLNQMSQKIELEEFLDEENIKTYGWWKMGIVRAQAVALLRNKGGQGIGTGFLVQAHDFGYNFHESLLLTNFHVIHESENYTPESPAPLENLEVFFEAAPGRPVCTIHDVLFESPMSELDTCLLRLNGDLTGIEPLRLSETLPDSTSDQILLIGYPGGGNLKFFFQNNKLCDIKKRVDPNSNLEISTLYYKAKTKGGSSGSPVFEPITWRAIGMHQAGAQNSLMRKGISILSIKIWATKNKKYL